MGKNVSEGEASRPGEISKDILAKVKIQRKFEIFVEEYTESDIGCQAGWRPVQIASKLGGNGGNPVITVTSQDDLQEKANLYRQLGQRFRIVREIDPPTQEAILKAAKEQGLIKDEEADKASGQPERADVTVRQGEAERAQHISAVNPVANPAVKPVVKPKIVTIGDMQIKYDGDRVYQKQWVRLTPDEASNFRVVSDSNNKLVSMNGRHIEARRWTLIENATDEIDPTEEMING